MELNFGQRHNQFINRRRNHRFDGHEPRSAIHDGDVRPPNSDTAIDFQSPEPPGQRDRVGRGVHLGVIVEVDEYLARVNRRR